MKYSLKLTSSLSLLALISCSPVYAAEVIETSQPRVVLNDVKIINNTGKDIAYRIVSASSNADNLYGVKAKKRDTYHAKATGDVNATIEVGECNRINAITGLCIEFDSSTMHNCVNEARYDLYKVKSIQIDSQNKCNVACNVGDTPSCIVK